MLSSVVSAYVAPGLIMFIVCRITNGRTSLWINTNLKDAVIFAMRNQLTLSLESIQSGLAARARKSTLYCQPFVAQVEREL